MRSRHQGDLIELVERIAEDTKTAGETTVVLSTKATRALLELAKRAPNPRGRPPVNGHNQIPERVAALIETTVDTTIALEAAIVCSLLELAKKAPKPRGRPPVQGRTRVDESSAMHIARSRKKKLSAVGKPKEAAHEEAAREASEGKLRSRNLSISTIKRRMETRRRR